MNIEKLTSIRDFLVGLEETAKVDEGGVICESNDGVFEFSLLNWKFNKQEKSTCGYVACAIGSYVVSHPDCGLSLKKGEEFYLSGDFRLRIEGASDESWDALSLWLETEDFNTLFFIFDSFSYNDSHLVTPLDVATRITDYLSDISD